LLIKPPSGGFYFIEKGGEIKMKKLIFGTLFTIFALALVVVPAFAAKPNTNNAGAQKVVWNLSGAVMPVPPYGLSDVIGSDTASKLIFNRPNGKVSAMLTGDMNGLNPNTTYTVYLSNGYTPYQETGWNVSGGYTMDLLYLSNHYYYTLTLNQSGNTITGSLNDPYLPEKLPVNGTITGNSVEFSVNYPTNYQGRRTFTGTINSSGVLSGNWNETGTEQGLGDWSNSSGLAIKTSAGDTGFPGLLLGVNALTFTTDSKGSGSWHYNFKNTVFPNGLSVWINGAGATILISDSITF
jgi:hypothetical protein